MNHDTADDSGPSESLRKHVNGVDLALQQHVKRITGQGTCRSGRSSEMRVKVAQHRSAKQRLNIGSRR
jgi:hypothetical protein